MWGAGVASIVQNAWPRCRTWRARKGMTCRVSGDWVRGPNRAHDCCCRVTPDGGDQGRLSAGGWNGWLSIRRNAVLVNDLLRNTTGSLPAGGRWIRLAAAAALGAEHP